ncbi:MAG: LPS-assembly protein LptD [Desulfatibacillaceae bacterium]
MITRLPRTSIALAMMLALFFLTSPSFTGADEPPLAGLADRPGEPWRVRADSLAYDEDAGTYTARGNALVWQGERSVTAEFIEYDAKKQTITARGNVTVRAGEDGMSGDRAFVDLASGTGLVLDGTLFVEENHFIISGSRIEKSGEATYSAEDATVTTCVGDPPDWEIGASKVNVTVDGYGTATSVVFRARGIPLLYVPWVGFPAKVTRQSGLLAPSVGQSGRKGFFWAQPLYWAFSDSADATFFAHAMVERGLRAGAEARYVLAPGTRGTFMYEYLHDRRVDDGVGDNTLEWGYTHDDLLRRNDDRYWFRAKTDWNLPSGWRAFADADLVSDQDYLYDFRTDYMGYEDSDDQFENTFSRDLDEYDETVRENRLHVNKAWRRTSFNGDVAWYDDVVARRLDLYDDTVQSLPRLSVHGARQGLFGSPVLAGYDTRAAYFYRDDGVRGSRLDLHPRLYAPVWLGPWLHVEPSAGVRQTLWAVDTYQDGPADDDRHFSRTLYDLSLDVSTELVRGYTTDTGALRHTIVPWARYRYLPDRDQEELPVFDDLDRIGEASLLSYGLATSLYATGGREGAWRALWFEIEHSYDLIEASGDDPAKFDSPDGTEPFGPVRAWLEFAPLRNLAFTGEARYDVYGNEFEQGAAGLSLTDPNGLTARVAYRMVADTSESVRVSGSMELRDDVSVYGYHEQDLFSGDMVESGVGAVYTSQCWSIDVGYQDEPGDWRVAARITLHGLGEIGTSGGF